MNKKCVEKQNNIVATHISRYLTLLSFKSTKNKETDLTFTTFITIKCLSKFAAIPFISSHKNIY